MLYKKLTNCIPDFATIDNKLKTLNKVNQLLANHLDDILLDNCFAANLKAGTLILATTSSAWGHNLRFQVPELLTKLRAEPLLAGIANIECKVMPRPVAASLSAETATEPMRLNEDNAMLLESLATTVGPGPLAKALSKLAKRSGPSTAADKQ